MNQNNGLALGAISRVLSDKFLNDLCSPDGVLYPILMAVRKDSDLSLQIRNNYINIYYYGGNVIKIARKKDHYIGNMHARYGYADSTNIIRTSADSERIAESFNVRKEFIARKSKNKDEKKFQQALYYTNSSKDFIIIDTEIQIPRKISNILYKDHISRFDMVAVARTGADTYKPVIIENKYGKSCMYGKCGVAEHVYDYCRFIASSYCDDYINMLEIQARQLNRLGIIKLPESFHIERTRPELLIIIAKSDNINDVLVERIRQAISNKEFADIPVAVKFFLNTDDIVYDGVPDIVIQ